jgi:NAD(P)-dependent dehydrogenase (short-subunit alcohol dehydrogenase family)
LPYQKNVSGAVQESDWDKVMSVNVKGTMFSYKHAAKQMIKQGRGGRIIGAASTASKKGNVDFGVYSASKFAVRGLTQCAGIYPFL